MTRRMRAAGQGACQAALRITRAIEVEACPRRLRRRCLTLGGGVEAQSQAGGSSTNRSSRWRPGSRRWSSGRSRRSRCECTGGMPGSGTGRGPIHCRSFLTSAFMSCSPSLTVFGLGHWSGSLSASAGEAPDQFLQAELDAGGPRPHKACGPLLAVSWPSAIAQTLAAARGHLNGIMRGIFSHD
jgi:hypothetical protein